MPVVMVTDDDQDQKMYHNFEPEVDDNAFDKMKEGEQGDENENVWLFFQEPEDQIDDEQERKDDIEESVRDHSKPKVESSQKLVCQDA